ncbi:MAG: selenocysteine-specific translation elongation factor [Lachnospiraceae bacterium]|nr:selenocysteine-specific translation elongation factor [Lachnospiraceae bacterium]
MKHVIIGTAGHVDHGKTCLIKALTEIDTDRLKEEKKRGITIELGFAYLDLANGQRVGIVDVPGHEKFVRNMLAGAGGMDLCMLVVAADEGIMPQTVEHLDILSILGIKKGVIVITKTDLVEPEFVDLVAEDVAELVEGTFLENAPIVPVSVYKEEGLEQLKQVLTELCVSLPERSEAGYFRLPIDRVFTLKGFGTIVTGTLMEGKLKKDQNIVLYPENEPVKVRSLQVHSKDAEAAWAGQRVAVNVPDRKKEEIFRGDVLATADSLYPTMMVDVKLEVLKHTERTIKHGSRVHIYHGTKELLGKVSLMNCDELKAGDSGYAQLRLEEKTVVRKGDHFVLRFYSPVETIGGGVVLDACPKKHRKNDRKAYKAFEIKENGTEEQKIELAYREHQGEFYSLKALMNKSAFDRSQVRNIVKKLAETGKLIPLSDEIYIHEEEMKLYEKRVVQFLDQFHKEYPLKEGMGLEEARNKLEIQENVKITDTILDILKKNRVIKEENGTISRYRFQVVVKEDEDAMIREITEQYLNFGFAPLTTDFYLKEHQKQRKFKAVFTSLLNKKILIRLDEQYCIHREYYEKAKEAFKEMAAKSEVIVLGNYRDYLECSRKVAVALLEHFDKNGFTRKTEEGRVLK